MKKFVAYTDGSCIGNPGPGGAAAIVIDENGSKKEIAVCRENTTNNKMEMLAVCLVLQAAPCNCEIEFRSDSRLVVSAFNEGWLNQWVAKEGHKSNGDQVENWEGWIFMLRKIAEKNLKVKFSKVAGHSGDEMNERADFLARSKALQVKQEALRIKETANGYVMIDTRGITVFKSY